jgi:signal transduction histidine kinase
MNVFFKANSPGMLPRSEYTDIPENVLIVEDDPTYSQLLKRLLLQAFGNIQLDCCKSAQEALTLAKRKTYQVLLVDYNLPDQSGYELLIELHRSATKFPPPAVMLTADGGAEAARKALQANAYDFMTKADVNTNSLERAIINALQKHALQKAVYQHAQDLETTNASLKKRNREISDFYQTVSHEVKTPLAASREFISLIRDGVLGPISYEQAEVLDYALSSCDQIASHFNDLVETTRLDSRKINLKKQETSINTILKRTTASCTRAIDEKRARLVISNTCESCRINVDENRIVQVLSNLVSNAIKYSPEESSVTLAVRSTDPSLVVFCVADNGFGIAPEHTEDIFNRLYQVGGTSSEHTGAGLGLGLSIAKDLVELHSGRIWVESHPGVGSQFYVELPK